MSARRLHAGSLIRSRFRGNVVPSGSVLLLNTLPAEPECNALVVVVVWGTEHVRHDTYHAM